MSAPAPRVGVGVPVYNGEAFLDETLADFAAQTFEAFELVVCDNASTDGTAAIATAWAERDARIRYVRNEANIGSLPNFNRAYHLAPDVEYFTWAAYDDCHAPDFLERLVAALDADPRAALAFGPSVYVDGRGEPLPYDPDRRAFIGRDGTPSRDDRALEGGVEGEPAARFERVLLSTMLNSPIYGLFRRSALERTSLFHFYGSDTLLLAEAALVGPFAYVDAAVFGWRFHAAGTSYMARDEWAVRETGVEGFEPGVPLRATPRYLAAVRRAGLGPGGRMRAYGAIARHFVKPERLRRVFLPGLDNYFGVRTWPWEAAPRTPAAR